MNWPKTNYFEAIDYKKNIGVCLCYQLNLRFWIFFLGDILLFNACLDKASAIETVELGLIPCQIKPNTTKINIHSFPAGGLALKGSV